MSKLSWSEVRERAINFSREWSNAKSEASDKQTFWNECFEVFGIPRKSVATFEERVTKRSGTRGAIDLFWKGKLLVEHKSRGEDLSKAEGQAFDYVHDLAAEGRHRDIPRYVLVSDFDKFGLFDLEETDTKKTPSSKKALVFHLADFHRHIRSFAFMLGQEPVRADPQDPANEEAYELMCELHDALERGGLTGHDLERFLVRVLFCLFAEDTGIFAPNAFQAFLKDTREDGSDLGARLDQFFRILDKPENSPARAHLDPDLAALPYVNGDLFRERLEFASFTGEMRQALLDCSSFYWARISPGVFGSLFQGILDPKDRREKGAHYTSERDILRLIRSLFLDDLQNELKALLKDRSTRRRANFETFHTKLRSLRFLDPACGCGNFLVVAYRELRTLEIEVIRELTDDGKQQVLELRTLLKVDVDQFFGIEIEEWPARIAEVALWLMDHQMNVRASVVFGRYIERLPLVSSPKIVIANATTLPWGSVLPPAEVTYVLGNPPFIGKKFRTPAQTADLKRIWGKINGSLVLDYVTCWYLLAAEYVKGTAARVGFVSTSSITQGEQPGILFTELFKRGITIHFAHRTFPWVSDAKGKAHVHVVIVGFGYDQGLARTIYDYDNGSGTGVVVTVPPQKRISPYLVQGGEFALLKRRGPISPVSKISFGNMANDDGNLILSDDECTVLVADYPAAKPLLRPYVGPDEFLYGVKRWCLWLVDVPPKVLRAIPPIETRIKAVRVSRSASTREATQALAATPSLFGERRQPLGSYIGIPKTTGEDRRYIPIAFFTPNVIASTDLLTIDGATRYEFGVISSTMHMAWVRAVCGRMKSDFRYSASIVYNNFPWPTHVDPQQHAAVERAALDVEAARAIFLPPNGTATIAELYDPVLMPPDLATAHAKLDRAVELCYRKPTAGGAAAPRFKSDLERVEFLLERYLAMQASPLAAAKRPRAAKKKTVP